MTATTWAFAADYQTDAGFRLLGADLNAKLAAAGLVQTADTGQANWASATKAGLNADGPYEIWRFNDAMQASAPIFFKLQYGTESTTNRIRVRIVLGTGSDGAGTITGVGHAIAQSSSTSGTLTGASKNNYLCVDEGFFGLIYAESTGTNLCAFGYMICRSCDVDGVATAAGALALRHSNSGSGTPGMAYHMRYTATAVAYGGLDASAGFIPGDRTTAALANGDVQAVPLWMIVPNIVPAFGLAAAYIADVPVFNQFSLALVGATARNYLQIGNQLGVHANPTGRTPGLCMLWE